MQPKKIARLAVEAAEDKKAEHTVILDVAKLTSVAHYFVITQGRSDRQVRTIADHIIESLEKNGVRVLHREGMETAKWVLIDVGDVLIHVFYHDTREFYGLERLWGEAPKVI
ncbi:MAG: ribosome silencing factor [Candidatus Omnitrophota bacterium]